jgi:hypothetical protein
MLGKSFSLGLIGDAMVGMMAGMVLLCSADRLASQTGSNGVKTLFVHVSPSTQKKTPVFRRTGASAVVYFSGMTIDADGAPNAYHPDDRPGLDALKNAGGDDKWWALVVGADGKPVVQRSGEFKGYFLSMTWLTSEDDRYSRIDPEYWVDARKVPYVAIPYSVLRATGIVKGDLAYVINGKTKKSSVAIVADMGTENTLGEGSIALARAVGVKSCDPRVGGQEAGIAYVVFPRSAAQIRWPREMEEMQSAAAARFQEWGGEEALADLRRLTSASIRRRPRP